MYVSGSGSPAAVGSVEAMIVGSARDAIVGETLDGTVLFWNRAAEELYGYAAAEMLGRRAEILYPDGRRDGDAATLLRVAEGQRVGEFISERVRRDGTRVRVCVRVAPLVDAGGATIGVTSTSWAGGELVSRVAHQLRTPLNAIVGFTGMLLMRLPGPINDEQEHQLELVRDSAEQLLSLINQLSRPDQKSPDQKSPEQKSPDNS